MAAQARLGDTSMCPVDIHGSVCCAPHPNTQGRAIEGSDTVMVNKRPAVRVGDHGDHLMTPCCVNMLPSYPAAWEAKMGSQTVFINGKAAHRKGDMDQHCGGVGTMQDGSDNVDTGD
jgi:uncharacterized Zn-binding protein involved in type VI secretion